MNKNKIIYVFSILFIIFCYSFSPGSDIYHGSWIDFNKNGIKDTYEDTSVSTDERIKDLIGQMTIEEKTCQLATLYGYGAVLKDRIPAPGWKDSIWKDGIANIDEQLTGLRKDTLFAYPYSAHTHALNQIQKWFIEETRLGIPADFTTEGIRGLNHMKATYFPAQIAQACSFDKELIFKIGSVTGKEAKALGYTNVYSPILDVASDPRWGRIEETYGADPFLVSQLGKQAILAIQKNSIVSTVKHFAVYSIPVGGRDGEVRVDPHVAPREMRELYLEPFRIAFQEAGAKGVMVSYNDYDGVPIIASSYFLTDILRNEFGFNGYVVSDSHAFEDLFSKHHVAKDSVDAARIALTAGMNVKTDFSNPRSFIEAVRRGIRNGTIPMNVVDERVKEVLRVKFWLGLFNHPFIEDEANADKIVHNIDSRNLALQAARESIVLLKNDTVKSLRKPLLPIAKNAYHTISIIGPNAKEEKSLLSRYGPTHASVVSVYEGIKQALPSSVKLLYAEGCKHIDDKFPESDIEEFDLTKQEDSSISQAVEIAKQSDIVLLVLGDNEKTIGETHSRLNLKFPGRQELLLERIACLNKPVVLIHVGGRPVTMNYAAKHIPSILETWYLGESTGTAIADILFGNINPSGKLCVPFPKHVGQIPLSFPMKPSADGYGDANVSGFLFPFGHGLSYTKFSYQNLKVDTTDYRTKNIIYVSLTVKNTGAVKGDEIVQLYIHDEISSVTTYVKKLRGFERVTLLPGEEKEVKINLKKDDFSLFNQKMQRVVEPGWFNIMVGSSSENICTEKRIQL